jgi:hypothetical protein
MQSPVLRAGEVLTHPFESYHMLVAHMVILPRDNWDGICNIRPSGGHCLHKASDHRLVYDRIAGFFIVLMDVDCVMLPIAFSVHAEIEGDSPEILHLEPLPHLILDLPNRVLVSIDKEIVEVPDDCGNNCAMIVMHEQSSVDR